MSKINTETKETPKKAHTYVQWIVGVIANSMLFSYGLQAGWMSPMAKILQSQSSPTGAPLSDTTLGWVASILPISALVFVPVFAFLADKFGRKTSILVMTVPQLASWLLKLAAPNTAGLMIARVCCGIAAGGLYTVVPMYNKEISQDSIRGAMGSLLVVFYNLGLLTIYALGAYLDYYTVLYIVVGVPILSFALILKCPESPGYLVKIGKLEEATKALSLLRGLDSDDKSIQIEVDAMKKQDDYYRTLPSLSMLVILKDKAWTRAVILATILVSIQSFSGNFALISYGAKIVAASGAQMNAELQTLSFPAVMMTGSIVSMCVVERLGRKVILLVTYVLSAASLVCLALLLQLPQDSAPAWMVLLAIVMSMLAYSAGVQPVSYIVMSDLFNIQIRAKLIGFVVAEAWIVSFAQLAAFTPITAALGMHTNFYIFATVHLFGIAAVLMLMPETRGKSIEEIETELRNK